MIKRFYILLLAIVASVGMMNAKVTWKSSNISDLYIYGTDGSYSKEGVTLSTNGDMIEARWYDYGDESKNGISFDAHQTGGFTFSNTLGKNFTKIEMTLNGPGIWDMSNLGSGWSFSWEPSEDNHATATWTGNASTVDLMKEASDFPGGEPVKSIVFYFEGDSEAPDPTYTVALEAGTANADKVTLSATSAVEGATVTVTPNDEYEITAFSATYAVVEDQVGTIYTIDATLNPETGAYSFKMPAYDVTIEATIALKPVPEGDVFAGFTATAGSGGFTNEGHANLVDGKFTSADWTKWCADNSYKSVPTGESGDACWWIDFEASAALDLTGYILTTGNDSGNEHGRNPKNWVLKAKLNADDAWTTIATVTNDVTMKNKSFKDYKFFVDQSGSYKYFRFEVFANQGANVMQLCQLRLIGTEASGGGSTDVIPCTAADLGKVLCTDGSIYATVSDATAANKTAVAMIAYIDTENGKALALALADESGDMQWETAKTTAPAHTPAVSGGTWTLASKDEWDNMITAAGSYTALRDGFSAVGGTNMQQNAYWSSTSFSYYAWCYKFNNGEWFDDYQDGENYVRACLAFDIPAAPAYETVMNLINDIPYPVVLTAECKAKIDAARAAYDALSDGDKAQVTNLTTLTDAETAYAQLLAQAVKAVKDQIDALPATPLTDATKKLSEYNKVTDAREAYDALSDEEKAAVDNYSKLTDAEAAFAAISGGTKPVDIVWDINTGINEVAINTTSPAYEGITVTTGKGNRFYQTTVDPIMLRFFFSGGAGRYAFAKEDGSHFTKVVLISSVAMGTWLREPSRIGTDWVVSDDYKKATWIGDADTVKIWDGASATAWVDVDSIVFTVNGTASPLADAQAALDKINAIPSPVVYTPECGAAIKAAREAVDALGANASLLDEADLNKLPAAEATYAGLLAEKVAPVIAAIDAVPATPLTDATKKLSEYNKVTDAREAYDALSDEEKAAVDNYSKLTDAEAAFAAIPSVGSETVITWDKNTGIEKISGTTTSPAYEGITISIKGGGFGPQDDMLRFNIAGLGLSFEFANTLGVNFQKIVISSTNAMPSTPLAGMGEGWAASSGNKIATWTGDAANVKIWDGLTATSYWDVNTIQFTLGATVSATEAAQAALDKINAIPSPVTLDEACVKAIKDAREAVTALGESSSLLDDSDLQKLNDAEAALTALNQAVADEVIAKINNIPTPVELKLATRDSINNARAAYDALNADQQALVSNYQTLLDAEDALASLNPGVPPATPLDSAQAVKDLIDAIPTPVEYPTSGAAIEAALAAYNQLSDAAKGALDDADVQTLNDAAAQYAALDAIAAIEAIPAEIVYDPAVKAAIETAREKYDALIDASKALVDDEVVAKLTNAEQAWADLVAKVEHNVSYIGKDGELKHETVALLHIPDPAPDFNGYEFVRWDVKGGDFLEEGLRVKAVYTPIITTNPQGFDTLAYNGLAQELVKAGVAKEGHIEYSLYPEEPESWSAELPKATIAGVYAIYYKLVREGHADYIAPEPTMATIAKVPVTYVAPTAVENLVYNASNQTLIAAGQTSDGIFEYSLDPTLLDSWKTELPQAKDAGTYSVYYRVQGDINHLDSTAVDPIAVTIAKAELTATADDKDLIYGDAVPAYTVTYAGWQGDDDAAVLTGDIAFACEYAQTSNVGEYTITPSGIDAANYAITFVNGKVTVAKADLMITADDKNVTYGDAVPEYTATYSGWKNADDASVISGLIYTCEYAPTSNVGEYTIVPSGATATNYNISYTNGKVTVAKADLMITADDKNVIYGDAVPEYTATYSGWKNTDDASVVSGLIVECEYAPTSNVGEYTITPSGATATNYNISYTNGKVTVAKAELMITADDKNVTYGDAVPEYTATYSGWKNTDDASVVSGLIFECEYAPTSNVGEYTITPSGATATNYEISFTNGKVTVSKATLTITANDTAMIYGDEHPEFTVTYSGWINGDDESMVSGLQFSTPYAPGSPIGTYAINPNSATALNYAIIFVDGTLTVNKAHVYVSDAEAQIAKFADGHANAVVLEQGILNGIKLNDPIAHVTTAAFSSADVAEHLTITLSYELTGDAALLNNYNLEPTSDIFTNEGVIIEPFIPDNEEKPEDKEATVNEGIEIYAYGYCDGSGYSLKYHLESGNPDQYKIDFADSRFTDVDWTNLTTVGKDGTIDINIPVDLPTGDYTMTVYFRDSRFDWLESRQLNVTFHVNLPETYVRPLFDNVIALVDTCECLTDIQWYWRANSTELWQPIEGANGYYYHVDGKLTGEYFVAAKMNGEPTFTCGQADMETLYGADQQAEAPVVRAYPNPVVNSTTVTIENSIEWIHNIRIVNLMGAEVMNATFEGDKTSVEMGHYPQGNYMISVDGIVVKVMKK